MWAGTGLSLSAGSFAAALPSWRSVVGGLPLGLAAAIEEKRAGGGEGSFHACEVLFARNPVSDRATGLPGQEPGGCNHPFSGGAVENLS